MGMETAFFIHNRREIAKYIGNGLLFLHSGLQKRVSAQETYDFRPNKMFYYLTGLCEPHLVLILFVEQGQAKEFLLIPKSDPLKESWEGKQLDKDTAAECSGIAQVYDLTELNRIWSFLIDEKEDFPLWVNIKDGQLRDLYTHFQLQLDIERVECIYQELAFMRSRKREEELEKLANACFIASRGVYQVMQQAKAGLFEYQLEAIHDYEMKVSGLKSGQYKTILAAGKNATILHYLDKNSTIGEQDLILMDIDVEVEHYHCDCTRVFPASGEFSPRQREVYSAVLDVQKALIAYTQPGITYGELNQLAKTLLQKACERLGLLQGSHRLEDYYFHRVGHLIGLDTHDAGEMEDGTVLREGMVLTIEPGLYIPEEEIGVRIEDMVALTQQGNRNLTYHIVKEIEDIERLMKKGSGYGDRCSK